MRYRPVTKLFSHLKCVQNRIHVKYTTVTVWFDHLNCESYIYIIYMSVIM